MLEFIEKSKWVTDAYFVRDFTRKEDPDSGFSFPCDKDGLLDPNLTDAAKANYIRVTGADRDKFIDNGVITRQEEYKAPAKVKDDCGAIFYLVDQHMGACQCPKCGKWYNLSGQELLPPDRWGLQDEDYGRTSILDDLGI